MKYIATKLLTINEWSYYTAASDLETLPAEERQKQDDEIYNRARLVNCAWFMRIILQDYVGGILGLQRDGKAWRLDPLAVRVVSISFQSSLNMSLCHYASL